MIIWFVFTTKKAMDLGIILQQRNRWREFHRNDFFIICRWYPCICFINEFTPTVEKHTNNDLIKIPHNLLKRVLLVFSFKPLGPALRQPSTELLSIPKIALAELPPWSTLIIFPVGNRNFTPTHTLLHCKTYSKSPFIYSN